MEKIKNNKKVEEKLMKQKTPWVDVFFDKVNFNKTKNFFNHLEKIGVSDNEKENILSEIEKTLEKAKKNITTQGFRNISSLVFATTIFLTPQPSNAIGNNYNHFNNIKKESKLVTDNEDQETIITEKYVLNSKHRWGGEHNEIHDVVQKTTKESMYDKNNINIKGQALQYNNSFNNPETAMGVEIQKRYMDKDDDLQFNIGLQTGFVNKEFLSPKDKKTRYRAMTPYALGHVNGKYDLKKDLSINIDIRYLPPMDINKKKIPSVGGIKVYLEYKY